MMRLGLASLLFGGAVGCVSNPTPHPGVSDTHVATADTSFAGGGPDDDHDGVPDCDEAGGVWSGSGCNLTDQATGTMDAVAEGDSGAPLGPDGADDGDGDEAEVGADDGTGAGEAGPSD